MSAMLVGGTVCAGAAGAAGAVGIAAGRGRAVDHRPAPPMRALHLSTSATVSIGLVLLSLVALGPAIALLIGVCSAGAMRISSLRRRARRTAAMAEQLVDAVGGLAAALRAGLSLEQALRFAAEETPPPLAESLRGIVSDIDLAVPIDRALERWSEADGGADARLICGVLRLDRRSGGDLPRILDQVAATLRERREAEGEIRALTAQARLSGLILGCLPVGFFLFLLLTSTKDVSAALHSPIGVGAIVLGGLLEVVAFVWIRHLLEVR